MTGKLIAWAFGTPMGRGFTLATALAIGVFVSWYAFSSHYEAAGYAKCQAEHTDVLNKANVDQANKNAKNDKTSSQIAKDAGTAAADVIWGADNHAQEAKKEIHDVYEKPPVTAPVSLGSCVHPVDERVQERIDKALDRANAAGR